MLRSKTSSWTRVACRRCSRLSGRWGASRKATSSAYSPLVNATSAPVGIGEAARAEAQPPPVELVASAFVVAGGNRARPVEPSQHGAHAGQKLPQVERFRHVVVGAELETDDAVDLVATVTGRDDDRHVGMRSDLPQQVETVLEAEPKIQDDDADFVRGKLTDHLLAARGQQRPDVVVDEIV